MAYSPSIKRLLERQDHAQRTNSGDTTDTETPYPELSLWNAEVAAKIIN